MTTEPNPAFNAIRDAIAEYREAAQAVKTANSHVDAAHYFLQCAHNERREAEARVKRAFDALGAFNSSDRKAACDAMEIALEVK